MKFNVGHLVVCVLLAFWHCTVAQDDPGGWALGKSTFFDGPDYFKAAFEANKFGDLYGNSCGYVDRTEGVVPHNGDLPFARESVGAISDFMTDYPGSCGRCYEVRCKSGYVMEDYETVKPRGNHDLDAVAPYLTDQEGRQFPGYSPELDPKMRSTQCWNESDSVVITIIDSCPCVFIGGRRQTNCCGPIPSFDLSFYAFEKLAHPLFGVMMIEYRPVDCESYAPLPANSAHVSSVIYSERPGAGWGWRTYFEKYSRMAVEGAGRGGSRATCAHLTARGGMAFFCRKCHLPGFQPFGWKTYVQFWIRSDAGDTPSSTPQGEVPSLGLYLEQRHELTYKESGSFQEASKFCNKKPILTDYEPMDSDGDWFLFQIPLLHFECFDMSIAEINRIAIFNPDNGDNGDAIFCLDEMMLV